MRALESALRYTFRPMNPLVFIAHHVRTGVTALNVVTAALGTDRRTCDVPIRFAKGRDELCEAIRAASSEGALPVVAWSFYSPDFAASIANLAWIREQTAHLGVVHVVGGVHATAEPLATLRAGFALVAVGEGEVTVIELVAALREGRDARALQGIAHLDDAGRLVSHGPGERRPLDDFPPFNAAHRKWNAIEITRGCIYACKFCQTPFMFKARFRHRSVSDVRAHVRTMRQAGLRYIRFLTPTSMSYGADGETPDLEAIEALLAAVREEAGAEGRVYFGTFPSEIRPEHVTKEALAILKKYVDNDNVVIGGQSGSQRVLDASLRGHSVADVERAVRVALEAGFLPNVDFLMGLPGEEAEDRRGSIELAGRLVALGARIHGHAFMPLPGTPWRDAAPTEIEPSTTAAMNRLEASGAMYGQWRRQLVTAQELLSRRRAAARS